MWVNKKKSQNKKEKEDKRKKSLCSCIYRNIESLKKWFGVGLEKCLGFRYYHWVLTRASGLGNLTWGVGPLVNYNLRFVKRGKVQNCAFPTLILISGLCSWRLQFWAALSKWPRFGWGQEEAQWNFLFLLSPSGDLGISLVWHNRTPPPTFWPHCWNPLQTELNHLWGYLSCSQDDIRWF